MKYIKDSNGFQVVANSVKVEQGGYTYNLAKHNDASEVLLYLMDIQATKSQFLQFGRELSKVNSPEVR